MSVRALQDRLVAARVLAGQGLGAGFPVLLPYGLRLVRRLHSAFVGELEHFGGSAEVWPPPVYSSEEYRHYFGATYDYTNVYEAELGGQAAVLRPDSLPWMLEHPDSQGRPIVSFQPLFRSETGTTQPLIRDRMIWGVAQVVHQTTSDDEDQAFQSQVSSIQGLLCRLRIPSLVVDAGPLRNHAERRALTFTSAFNGRTWLTSTVYVLATEFARRLGAAEAVVELGYSAKLLALSADLHADAHGLRFPSCIAEDSLVVDADDEWRRALKRARRDGLPLVYRRRTGARPEMYRRDRNAVIAPLPRREVLAQHDDALWDKALAAQQCLYGMNEASDAKVVIRGRDSQSQGYEIGPIVDANYTQGREAAEAGAVLIARKPRIY